MRDENCGVLSGAASWCNCFGALPFRRLDGIMSYSGHKASLRLGMRWVKKMTIRGLMKQTVGVGLLLLSGCDATRNMRDDFARLTSPQAAPAQARKNTGAQPAARPRNTVSTSPTATEASATTPAEVSAPPARPSSGPAVALTGKSENELRALLGTPTSEEDRPPGKRWRYRDGQCTLDVQLYPDVQTKQFGTLAYEVKSDDNTDEGKRLCLAQLQSRVQARQ
jgi:hypothetical protein